MTHISEFNLVGVRLLRFRMNIKYAEKSIQTERFNTAVLFVVFNRLNTTSQVFETIRNAKPLRLYVAADGPRLNVPDDIQKTQEVRDFILKNIDWDCEVKTLFREGNLGCGRAVKTAIDWFFTNEDSGIILEDDVVPLHSFFYFCSSLLEIYSKDHRIAMISGINHVHYKPNNYSYLYSKNKGCWGWATWKRAWDNMDYEMKWRETSENRFVIKNMGVTSYSLTYWKNSLALIDNKVVDAWDWQWYFSIAAQNQLCIFPEINLIKNIGFGSQATHTKGKPRNEFFTGPEILFPLRHPPSICPNYEFDQLVENLDMRKNFKHKVLILLPLFLQRILRRLYHGK